MQYGLTGKLMSKGEIMGFFLVDAEGKELLLSKEKTLSFAEDDLVNNWEVVTDSDGEKHLYSYDMKLCDLPNNIKDTEMGITILGKIMKNGKLAGYVCIDADGNQHNYSVNKLWQMVKFNRVTGVRACISNGSRVMESETRYLRDLKEYKAE